MLRRLDGREAAEPGRLVPPERGLLLATACVAIAATFGVIASASASRRAGPPKVDGRRAERSR